MGVFFGKLAFVAAYLLSALSGFDYISIPTHDLSFDYKTGEGAPIVYYLNLKNIGPQKARFDLSSSDSWLRVYREGNDIEQSLEIEMQAAIRLVVEVDPRRLQDGIHHSKITIIAAKPFYSEVYDTETVDVEVRKDYVPTPTPSVSPKATESQVTSTPRATESIRPTGTALSTIQPSASIRVKASISPTRKTSPVLKPTQTRKPSATPSQEIRPSDQPSRSFWDYIFDFFR